MRKSLIYVTLLLVLLLIAGCGRTGNTSGAPSGSDRTTKGVVRQIDHIIIRSKDAGKLFDLLTKTLQLPVAWPMSDYGGFTSGGVSLGNVNLEVISSKTAGAAFAGFALEPEPLAESLRILDERRVPYGKPSDFRSGGLMGIGGKTLWTTVALPSVSSDAVEIFLCEYKDDVGERRRERHKELRSHGGGPLSAVSVREVSYGAKNAPQKRKRWEEILSPLEASAPGLWPVGEGPAIRVTEAPGDGLLDILVNVRSLSKARTFLSERKMIREDRAGRITLGGPELEGLTVTIVEDGVD